MRFLIFLSNSGGHIMPGLTFGNYLKNKGEKVTYVASNQKTSKLLIKDECIWVDSNTICKESLKNLKKVLDVFDFLLYNSFCQETLGYRQIGKAQDSDSCI